MPTFDYHVGRNTAVATAALGLTTCLQTELDDPMSSGIFFSTRELREAVEQFRAAPGTGMVDSLRVYLQTVFAPVALLSAAHALLTSQDAQPGVEPSNGRLLVRPGAWHDCSSTSVSSLTGLAHWALTGYTLSFGSDAHNRAEKAAAQEAEDAVAAILTGSPALV